MNESLDDLPTLAETQKAIHQLSNGKAPGNDSIPAEIYKEGGTILIEKLHELYQQIWTTQNVPQDFKDAAIVHLYKRKGNQNACTNHRGISLLVIAGKIFARIILNRLTAHLENGLLPESQCGFRKFRGTSDMVFTARQLQEKCQEQHRDLYIAFIDLTKAFDTVIREGLLKIMAMYGCPTKFINIVKQLHDGMKARVQDNGEFSEPFSVSNGVKQGCVLAPTLFSIIISAMLADAFKNGDEGINIIYRMDGQLFNLKRLKAKTKIKTYAVRDLLFADDCALSANSEADLQTNVDRFANACSNFGLIINLEKT